MIIQTTRSFDKQYARLSVFHKQRFKKRLALFRENPYDRVLRNHGLKGKYLGYRSIDVTGDVRVFYRMVEDRVVIFAFIGTHGQLYG